MKNRLARISVVLFILLIASIWIGSYLQATLTAGWVKEASITTAVIVAGLSGLALLFTGAGAIFNNGND